MKMRLIFLLTILFCFASCHYLPKEEQENSTPNSKIEESEKSEQNSSSGNQGCEEQSKPSTPTDPNNPSTPTDPTIPSTPTTAPEKLINDNNLPIINTSNKGFSTGNYTDENIYILIRITGNSDGGNFIKVSGGIFAGVSYPKYFELQTKESDDPTTKYIQFSGVAESEFDGVVRPGTPGYDATYGWTNPSGTTLNLPFYIKNEYIYIPKNTKNSNFTMRNIVVGDPGDDIEGKWLETVVSLVRYPNATFSVPLSHYDESKHQNCACFTIHFSPKAGIILADAGQYNATVTFDGFLPK